MPDSVERVHLPRLPHARALTAAALVVVLAACGGGDDDASSPTTAPASTPSTDLASSPGGSVPTTTAVKPQVQIPAELPTKLVVTDLVEGSGKAAAAGDTVATIEAMKMEAAITAPRGGQITRLAIGGVQQVEGGDLLVVVSTEESAE